MSIPSNLLSRLQTNPVIGRYKCYMDNKIAFTRNATLALILAHVMAMWPTSVILSKIKQTEAEHCILIIKLMVQSEN